jgi:hypothetical protein
MGKSIAAVVISYIAMMLAFFAVFTALYFALGAERVFEPGTFKITPLWIALALAGALGAGALGGLLCFAISGSFRACQMMAVIVFVLALVMCIPSMTADQTPRPRSGDLPTMEAMQQGQAPIWMHLLSAAFFGGGVLFGARMKRSSRPE